MDINTAMEWSKEKTLKLIELLQRNPNLWNPALCETRRDKQKRKEEIKTISTVLEVSIPDISKKIQHLRTQYNRESSKETRAKIEEPNEIYISNWYAFEYLHFIKDSNKPYKMLHSGNQTGLTKRQPSSGTGCKLLSPTVKPTRPALDHQVKYELAYPSSDKNRDEYSVFGEYIANELRSLKGEKNLLIAKKKIQDVIYEVKMGMISELRTDNNTQVYSHNSLGSKIYTTSALNTSTQVEPVVTNTPPTSGISEIIISGGCHYTDYKVDS